MAAAPSVLSIHLPDALQAQDAFVDKRWAIWRASKPLFERYGFSGVTFDQLAHASGMVPITIYRYFPNKQAVALFPLAHANGLQHAWHCMIAKLPANQELRLDRNVRGAVIMEVEPGSPAARVGLSEGDVITRVGRQPVQTAAEARDELARIPSGGTALMRVTRNGQETFVTVTKE